MGRAVIVEDLLLYLRPTDGWFGTFLVNPKSQSLLITTFTGWGYGAPNVFVRCTNLE